MSSDTRARERRAVWTALKTAATEDGESLLSGLTRIALGAWEACDAGTKLSEDRATREAFVASLVGAAMVDVALDKLAADGTYTTPEVEFLRDLNAEAALRDFARFQKNAGYADSLRKLVQRHPSAFGAAAGGIAGAGFGAYADDEDRLRGALRFGLPGAAMGAMLGQGAGQLSQEARETRVANKAKALEDARAAELHSARMALIKEQQRAAARAGKGQRRR